MNAYICSYALHGQFAHTLLAREKKVGYFLNSLVYTSAFECCLLNFFILQEFQGTGIGAKRSDISSKIKSTANSIASKNAKSVLNQSKISKN